MQRFLPLVSFLLVSLFCQHTLSQSNSPFTEDPEIFAGELRSFMARSLNEGQSAEMEAFIQLWESGSFNLQEKEFVIATANKLRLRNARPVPHIFSFMETLSAFAGSGHRGDNFRVWQEAFTRIAGNSDFTLTGINDFLITSRKLVTHNLLYSSGAFSWKSDRDDFRMVLDGSLRIVFGNTSIIAFNHIDTLAILNTSGHFYPEEQVWKGSGGRVTWERGGLDQGEAEAGLAGYTVNLSRNEYTADSVSFSFSRYLTSPMTGRLTDRLMSTSNRDNAGYPRFESYGRELKINGIYEGVDYEGGFSVRGSRLIGSGGDTGNAIIHFHLNGERWLTTESGHFVFRPRGMSSVSASILFHLENDTVYHPDMHLNYIDQTRELSITSNQKVISQSPWFNGFHNIDMRFSQLVWNIDEQEIKFTMPRAASAGHASFESLGFFNRHRYNRLQGMSQNHPFAALRNFAAQYNHPEMPVEDYARALRRSLPEVRRQLLDLTIEGFIFYDTETDMFRIRPKLQNYLQANARRIDYDIITFESTTEPPNDNAVLDLTTNDLTINGIPRVHISNTHNVGILPVNNTLTLKRNRNFNFDGTINAGNLSFFGSNFTFDYELFTINLQNVDSIRLRARLDERDAYGQALLTQVTNTIHTVTGELVIDRPFNKSGRVEMPEYPKFNSTEYSYVFYDRPGIYDGVYESGSFYFELEPFMMDSLNTFRNENLRFNGKLVSAGIFPDITEQLVLQDDYSLGMNHTVPGGIPVYGDRGTFYHEIQLSNSGLTGSGRLGFHAAELSSNRFIFFPDSMKVTTDDFIVHRQTAKTEFPAVKSSGNKVKWLPYDDKMSVYQYDDGFSLFSDKALLKGRLELGSSGLRGAGSMSLEYALVSSDNYMFKSESFSADTGGLILQRPDRPPAISASGISFDIDVAGERGVFIRPQEAEEVLLVLNGYVTNPASIEWDMSERRFDLLSELVCSLSGRRGASYTSTGSGQDSLYFFSPHAVVDYRNEQVRAEGVEYIEVADALVYPSGETVIIAAESQMMPLKDARVIAGSNGQSHEIYGSDLSIDGKYSYRGSGYIDYRNERDEIQQIRFDEISVNADTITFASGKIGDKDNFMLSPWFSFSGNAELLANRRLLKFSGISLTVHDCLLPDDRGVSFSNIIDPVEVLIPVAEQPLSEEGERIYAGIFIATDSVHIYPAFFTPRRNWADRFIITANGYMKYDQLSGEYRITSVERHHDPGITENMLSLDPYGCIMRGEGPLELGVDLGQVEISAMGQARNEVNINETQLEGMLMLDFFLSDEALGLITAAADRLQGEPVSPSSWYYERGLKWMLGNERAEAFRNEVEAGNTKVPFPEEMEKTFLFSDIKLVWNKESRSYRSHGPIGIAAIGGTPVNRSFTGYLEITKRRSGDFADLYIEFDENTWYYFGYTRGTMQTYSSDTEYLRIVEETPLRHRRMSVPARDTRYVYMLATDTKMEQFFRVYRRHLEGQTLVIPDEEIDYPDEDPD